ncbi:MAG: class D sortase [Candidatus Saccharimonadales bacterium]
MNPQDISKSHRTPRNIAAPKRDAAVRVARDHINSLYESTTPSTITTPAKQTRPATPAAHHASAAVSEPWQQYHSAWQEYYQQYYQQYYTGHAHKIIVEERQKSSPSHTIASTTAQQAEVNELRDKIQQKVQANAKKVRKSRHFIPISAAVVVMLVFAFLQYNSILIGTVQAYISPGAIDPQNIVVDPTTSTSVSSDPRLIIPKINVDVPVIYGVGNDHTSQMTAMEKGVAHFSIPGASSVPGQIGNTTISGHSSNDLFESGDYKFVFAQLEKLEQGDTIYANYEGTRYTYTVTQKEIVLPTDVKKLTYATDKPILTLITCWPLGTANKRLLVTAEQVAPDPAKAAPAASSGSADAKMPGTSATALEKLFGR